MNDGFPTVYFKDLGREMTCYFFPKEANLPDETGKLMVFYRIWKDAWKDGKLPSWSDFKFEDFIGWHSFMRVMDIGGTIDEYKKNLIVGEQFANGFGRTTLYEIIRSDNPPGQEAIDKYDEYLSHLYNQNICITEGTTHDEKGKPKKFKWIELPLSNDGETVTHLMTALQYED